MSKLVYGYFMKIAEINLESKQIVKDQSLGFTMSVYLLTRRAEYHEFNRG